ncbi:MAG: IclR family transcriptional regulator [Actinobacteria bacterium]|nr:IclR family transcriptional regulator [Actinomycetota bacterium]
MELHSWTACTTGKMEENGSQIQVIDRAVALMRALSDADGPVGLRDLARRVGLSPSTTRRILASLAHHGLCEQTPEGSYRLGLVLFELGSKVEANLDVRTRSLPALQRLSEQSHLTAFVCIQRDDRAIAIERVDGRYAFSLALTVGGSLPLHAGGASRALLAFLPEEEIRRLLGSSPREAFTGRTITDPEEIVADLREVRERGYAISDEDVTPGVAALGMPVFGHLYADRPVASVSIAGLVPQVLGDDRERLLGLLREAAEEISRELGHGLTEGQEPGKPSEGAAA